MNWPRSQIVFLMVSSLLCKRRTQDKPRKKFWTTEMALEHWHFTLYGSGVKLTFVSQACWLLWKHIETKLLPCRGCIPHRRINLPWYSQYTSYILWRLSPIITVFCWCLYGRFHPNFRSWLHWAVCKVCLLRPKRHCPATILHECFLTNTSGK